MPKEIPGAWRCSTRGCGWRASRQHSSGWISAWSGCSTDSREGLSIAVQGDPAETLPEPETFFDAVAPIPEIDDFRETALMVRLPESGVGYLHDLLPLRLGVARRQFVSQHSRATMKAGVVAVLLPPWLTAPSRHAPGFTARPNAAANAERIEKRFGAFSRRPNPWPIASACCRFSSFPDLPGAVAAELNRRGCMIPQSFEAKQPENVIHGAFRAAGSSDWAALCSSQQTTTLYVFSPTGESPIALPHSRNSGVAWDGAGAPRFLDRPGHWDRSVAELRSTPAIRRGLTIDHDAIDDARLERSWSFHYFEAGRWVNLRGDDAGA